MAGASQSTSTTRSQSTSDTYIPEYSQTPFLQEYANHARAMSDQVYAQGMDIYNKRQGDIDGVMRDALSYASPQRIAVDMGMAEAGVQQAGERGRLSAERDLESYEIDPSSGRYAALDSANRVMTAAAAAGAGNQQRMADQAAGNAMRQQAISAGLQNANYASSVNRDANAFLQTASSLKYPPLGRTSQSTSATDSQSSSVQTDPPQSGGGSKGGGEPRQPSGGGGGQRQPAGERSAGDRGGGGGGGRPAAPAKPPPGNKPEPQPPIEEPEPKPEEFPPEEKPGQEGKPQEGEKGPSDDSGKGGGDRPFYDTDEPTMPDYNRPTDEPTMPDYNRPTSEPTMPDYNRPTDEPTMPDVPPIPMRGETLVEDDTYDPYAGNVQQAAFEDPNARWDRLPQSQNIEDRRDEADPAGALYGQEAGGGWTDTGTQYGAMSTAAGLSDIDQSFDVEPGGMELTPEDMRNYDYNSTYDSWGPQSAGYEWPAEPAGPDYESYYEPGEEGGYEYESQFDDEDLSREYEGTEDSYYEDPYADYSDEDFYGDFEDQYGEDDYTDYGDVEDYGDDSYEAEGDEGYDAYEDYGDGGGGGGEVEDYGEYDAGGNYEDFTDYQDSGGGDYSYDEGARGGAVMRGRMRQGKRRARIMPPGRPRPRTGYAGGGPIPQQAGMRLAPQPRPPGAAMRAPQPQQASRPMRGAPMAAPGGPRPTPMGRGPRPMPGNMISANGMPPPTGMPQRMAQGGQAGQAGRRAEPTTGGFVSREMSPSGGSTTDDVQARLNAGEFVIPKDVATWKGKEFFYKLIAQARKNRSVPNGGTEKPQTGFSPQGPR